MNGNFRYPGIMRASIAMCTLALLGFFLASCGSSGESKPEPEPQATSSEEQQQPPPPTTQGQSQTQVTAAEKKSQPPSSGAQGAAGSARKEAPGAKPPEGKPAESQGEGAAKSRAIAATGKPSSRTSQPKVGSTKSQPNVGTAEKGEKSPFEKIFPELVRKIRPLRIAVLSSPTRPNLGQRVAFLMMGIYQRDKLERSVGRRVEIAYVSQSNRAHRGKSVIHYRPDFIKAAIMVASIMPGEQRVEPMNETQRERRGVDIIIFVGEEIR